MRIGTTLLSILCLAASSLAAQTSSPSGNPSGNLADIRTDYPELSQRGPHPVGYREVEVVDPQRIDFLHSDMATGKMTLADRHLFVTIWYPAASGDPKTVAHYDRHPGAGPGSPYAASAQFPQTGLAIADAPPLKGAAPLVIFSHGYTNWAAATSQLAEVLASRGYVFASIDHDDIPVTDRASAGASFINTASGRARDQRAVAAQLRKWASNPSFPLTGCYDPDNLALLGYSMGGFGALQSAGAGFDPDGAFFKRLPKPPFEGLLQGEPDDKPIPGLKALILFAPWGAQPANRAWSAAGLAAIKAPTLIVDGDHDDVAGYREGVRWVYDNLTSSDRYLLTFENARHNIVGVEAPPQAYSSFSLVEKWDEPVWRKDRIQTIDDHFVVAFLDRYLRNDTSMDSYLNPATPHSNDGTWTQTPGQPPTSPYAGHDPGSEKYWKGFQQRWALGLELEHTRP